MLRTLVKKLDSSAYHALEAAIGLCAFRTHYNVEVEHWLLKLLDENDAGSMSYYLEQYALEPQILKKLLNEEIDRFKTGNGRTPVLGPLLIELLTNAWNITTLEFNHQRINAGHVLYALIKDEFFNNFATPISNFLMQLNITQLYEQIERMPNRLPHESAGSTTENDFMIPEEDSDTLSQFTTDLTAQAQRGEIDAVLGRDEEIRQITDILCRRRQNNPMLVGDAGVGKTAVVEGLALAIIKKQVPPNLQDVSIRMLDIAALQAGTGVKGEFEKRLKAVIHAVQKSPKPTLLFIDEAHALFGTGGSAAQNDTANLLKPALARGELRTLAATTWIEYKKFIEPDPALMRRFQLVKIDEPTIEKSIVMLRGLANILEKHHQVKILDEAITSAVKLSSRYLPGRQLPDKAVSLLDTACSRVYLSQTTMVDVIEDCNRRIEQLTTHINRLQQEEQQGEEHSKDLLSLNEELITVRQQQKEYQVKWNNEHECLVKIKSYLQQLAENTPIANDELRQNLKNSRQTFKELQGETPYIYDCVNSQVIASVISTWTGIPIGRMMHNEVELLLNLEYYLAERIIGQDLAIHVIAEHLKTSAANLQDPHKPRGVFLLVGPSGVGKTETALALADMLYGGQQNLTVINMSEFKEPHKISMLTGSPAGYVGYGEGGVLTEAVRRHPYRVILLDEMEKAHPSVQEVFYQVFDKGMLMDGSGNQVDFSNTLILMASNAGTDIIMDAFGEVLDGTKKNLSLTEIEEIVRPSLREIYRPAFLGRVKLLPYRPLDRMMLQQIACLKLLRVINRVKEQYQVTLSYSTETLNKIVSYCQVVDSGAREIDNIINSDLLPKLSQHFLASMGNKEFAKDIEINIDENQNFNVKEILENN